MDEFKVNMIKGAIELAAQRGETGVIKVMFPDHTMAFITPIGNLYYNGHLSDEAIEDITKYLVDKYKLQ